MAEMGGGAGLGAGLGGGGLPGSGDAPPVPVPVLQGLLVWVGSLAFWSFTNWFSEEFLIFATEKRMEKVWFEKMDFLC